MTEPEKKDEFKFLDDVVKEPKKKGYTGKIVIGLVVVSFGLISSLWWGKTFSSQGTIKNPQPIDPKTDRKDSQYVDITNFAEKFTIMAFNVSYTDISHQTDKVGNLMSDNMMSYYQEAFLGPKWVAFLKDNKAYVSYQQIERSTVENTDGTHYWVRVIGKCLFNSDARGPGSQIELPFNLMVVVKNDGGRLVVTDFQRL
jgi:hypothetical protein